ncbi:lipid-binding SYLF domain-containing protein [Pararhodospirillum oryzae]|uniref:Ysc84 actin-binding domain-containing protein n=1 Tax=Pararhodospirillum oryzae TaxID=478448 RepID=A0A512H6Q8_9PROT|nr:lipid-binding SYLF domain-containing protein [Pararhodospirillum oryzae]GEO81108.1 hypothetical protein ROR02_12390 [Pararhodospirillum oryzae]
MFFFRLLAVGAPRFSHRLPAFSRAPGRLGTGAVLLMGALATPGWAQQGSGPISLTAPPAESSPAYGAEFGPGGGASSPGQPVPLVPSGGEAGGSSVSPPSFSSSATSGASPLGSDLPDREVGRAPGTPPASYPPAIASEPVASSPGAAGSVGPSVSAGAGAVPVSEAAAEARALMGAAEATFVRLTADTGFGPTVRDLMTRARGVLIVPDFYKAGFFLAAAYGNGVLMARGPDGRWSDPAFYRLTAGSLGFQVGLQNNEVVMVIMTEAGLRAVMEDHFKGGATISATFFLVGGGADASTTTDIGQDIYAYSHSVGLFGGAGLEGTAIQPRTAWNEAVYGGGVTPDAILIQRVAHTDLAQGLHRALAGVR